MKPEKRLRVFAAMIDKDKSGCWNWVGFKRHGYGVFLGHYAHRVSYQIHTGKDPASGIVHHTCQNRACVNPAHLQLLTTGAENTRADAVLHETEWQEFLKWKQRRARRRA